MIIHLIVSFSSSSLHLFSSIIFISDSGEQDKTKTCFHFCFCALLHAFAFLSFYFIRHKHFHFYTRRWRQATSSILNIFVSSFAFFLRTFWRGRCSLRTRILPISNHRRCLFYHFIILRATSFYARILHFIFRFAHFAVESDGVRQFYLSSILTLTIFAARIFIFIR